jgi:hypothetical protein
MRLLLLLAVSSCTGTISRPPLEGLGEHAGDALTVAVIGAGGAEGPVAWAERDAAERGVSAVWHTGSAASTREGCIHWPEERSWSFAAATGRSEVALSRRAKPSGAYWGARDLEIEGQSWRLLVLDATATGSAADEQLFWVPKAVSQRAFDHLILLMGASPWSMAESAPPDSVGQMARRLLDEVEGHDESGRLRLVLTGDTGTQEAVLPTGPWGPLWIVAGNTGRPARPVPETRMGPAGDALRLAPGLERLRAGGLSEPGWWEVTLRGSAVAVGLRLLGEDAKPHTSWQITHTAESGWRRAVDEQAR